MSQSATVMLVGASGVGKSTLGNYLLFEGDSEVFETATGTNPVTTRCEYQEDNSVPGQTFKVIDTPGMPDPHGNAATYFNDIVKSARDAGSLNAIVLVMDYVADRNHLATDFQNASVLLQQFSKLGCAIVVACRVPSHLPRRDKDSMRKDVDSWTAFVNAIVEAAGLDTVAIFLLQTPDMVLHARAMRSSIVQYPAISVRVDRGMQTFDELQRSLWNRTDKNKRRDQLREEVARLQGENKVLDHDALKLERSAERCRQAGHCASVGAQSIAVAFDVASMGALVFLPSVIGVILGLGAEEVGSSLMRMKERDAALKRALIRTNDAEVAAMSDELATDGVDAEQMNVDGVKLEKLEGLLQG